MESGCPICNGLLQLSESCPSCGTPMEDCGSIENYTDPYGPYEEQEAEHLHSTSKTCTGDNQCVHFLQCPNCDESLTYTVDRNLI